MVRVRLIESKTRSMLCMLDGYIINSLKGLAYVIYLDLVHFAFNESSVLETAPGICDSQVKKMMLIWTLFRAVT